MRRRSEHSTDLQEQHRCDNAHLISASCLMRRLTSIGANEIVVYDIRGVAELCLAPGELSRVEEKKAGRRPRFNGDPVLSSIVMT